MMVTYACYTNSGSRPVNEDSIGVQVKPNQSCFVVCDGLGGHGMGDEASHFVSEYILNAFNQTKNADAKFLDQCFPEAQVALSKIQADKKLHDKMKTTAVCMTVQNKKAYAAYVGDSRFYAFGAKKVKCQSEDHSIPYRLYLSKQIHYEEIRNHPERNMLMRVMGIAWSTPMHQLLKPMPLWKYQAFLLCTDGFWELITEQTMCKLLQEAPNVEQWLDAMIQEVQKNGAGKEMDNYSAIAVFCK